MELTFISVFETMSLRIVLTIYYYCTVIRVLRLLEIAESCSKMKVILPSLLCVILVAENTLGKYLKNLNIFIRKFFMNFRDLTILNLKAWIK